MTPDTTGNGFLQTIGSLVQGVGHIVSLGNGFRHVGKRDHKPAVLYIWGERGGIDKALHSNLLQINACEVKLGQHRLQCSGLQLVFWIPHNGMPFAEVQCPMTSLAALRDKLDLDTALTSKFSDSTHEFIACHKEQYRTYMTDKQEKCMFNIRL